MCKKIILTVMSVLLIFSIVLNLTGCSTKVQLDDLLKGINANKVAGKASDDDFSQSQMRLAVDMFKSSVLESKNENVLISPLSVQLALAMTANGADGETKAEMEALLGGKIPLEELNEYLYAYVKNLPSEDKFKLQIANSIWFRDDEGRLQVEQDFLQKNADYYGAQVYKDAFDEQTLKDINNWVKEHTDGMIDKILEEIDPDTVMYLINALVFDAEWEHVYDKSDVYKGKFTNISGTEKQIDMMHSEESIYLQDKKATGFMKSYSGGKYSFAALLPNEGVDIYDYIADLTGESLTKTLSTSKSGMVMATLPKFSYEYELTMNELLKDMGMPTAFSSSNADFLKLGKSTRGNIYIGEVLHKTFISVDELGTKAGAVTKVEMKDECAAMSEWVVNLNRPFVYMIVDNETNLPVFIGTMMDVD